MPNYLTGAAKYVDGWLEEIVLYCYDEPDEEMQSIGFFYDDYVADAQHAIDLVKRGSTLVARFHGVDGVIPVEVITINGRETLEIVQRGQAKEYASLRNLPEPGTSKSNEWSQSFYDELMRLSQGSIEMLAASTLSFELYSENKDRDPVEFAREYHAHTH